MWTWGGEGSGEGSGVFGVRGSERYTRRTRVPTHITHTQVTHYTHTSPHPQPRTQRTYAPTPTHPPIQSSTQRGLRQRTPTEESYTHAPTYIAVPGPFLPVRDDRGLYRERSERGGGGGELVREPVVAYSLVVEEAVGAICVVARAAELDRRMGRDGKRTRTTGGAKKVTRVRGPFVPRYADNFEVFRACNPHHILPCRVAPRALAPLRRLPLYPCLPSPCLLSKLALCGRCEETARTLE